MEGELTWSGSHRMRKSPNPGRTLSTFSIATVTLGKAVVYWNIYCDASCFLSWTEAPPTWHRLAITLPFWERLSTGCRPDGCREEQNVNPGWCRGANWAWWRIKNRWHDSRAVTLCTSDVNKTRQRESKSEQGGENERRGRVQAFSTYLFSGSALFEIHSFKWNSTLLPLHTHTLTHTHIHTHARILDCALWLITQP